MGVKTGLVLEGGAMRGMFTAGVLDVFMENGIDFDGAIGVSAGAVFGCNLKSGQPGRVIRYNKRFCADKRYVSISSLIKTGDLYNADFCYHKVPKIYDPFDADAFSASDMEFYAVATDVETGQPCYHLCMKGDDADITWMQASASMPLASRMVEIDGHKYLDGGISDPIPLRYFEHLGYEKNVVILTQPASYTKKKNSLLPVIHAAYREYPSLVEKIETRHHDYNETLRYVHSQKRRNKVFIIQPEEPLKIGPMEKDSSELDRVYQLGLKQARKQLPELMDFLSN